jgi:hypothetical protein
MSAIEIYLRLGVALALVLAPGWLISRALGVRTVGAALAWSLTILFGALSVTFVTRSSLTLTLGLLGLAGVGALAAFLAGRREAPALTVAPGRRAAAAVGVVLGLYLWRVAGSVEGDGLFHLARARKLLAIDELSLRGVGEFADASLHPGYAFPLWQGFLALVARVSGVDLEQVVLHLPSLLAPLAVVVAYEAGWALFRRRWAATAVGGAQVALFCLAPGDGGAYPHLSLPATAADQLLVPAALALALATVRTPILPLFASTAAAGFVLAVVHPTYALFLWIPFVGFLLVRLAWTKRDLRGGVLAAGALVVPASLFLLWLLPVVTDTASVSPEASEVARALDKYAGQLDVRSESSYSLAPEVFTRRGAVAIAALLLVPFAALAARRRWAAYVVGGSLAVFVVTLLPFVFTPFSDLVSLSQARRLAAFLPFAFAFAGGLGVLARLVGPLVVPAALVAGVVLQWAYPGDFGYVLDDPGPALVTWIAVAGAVVGLVVGLTRRRPSREATAGLAAALFLVPVAVVGLTDWSKPPPGPGALTSGLVDAVRESIPERAVVYSDPQTSYRIAAAAPVYVAVAPPGHVADTEANRPYERARDARRFLRTGDLSIPESYGAEFLVVSRATTERTFELDELYRDARFALYGLPGD